MAELDYAFLADFATVEGGRLTAVGASFTHVEAPMLPLQHSLSIAGRIRAPKDFDRVLLGVTIRSPGEQYVITGETELLPGGASRPYRDRVGILFAISVSIALTTEGLYTVDLHIDGEHARQLAFEVSGSERA